MFDSTDRDSNFGARFTLAAPGVQSLGYLFQEEGMHAVRALLAGARFCHLETGSSAFPEKGVLP